jgi:hypothetical protein
MARVSRQSPQRISAGGVSTLRGSHLRLNQPPAESILSFATETARQEFLPGDLTEGTPA